MPKAAYKDKYRRIYRQSKRRLNDKSAQYRDRKVTENNGFYTRKNSEINNISDTNDASDKGKRHFFIGERNIAYKSFGKGENVVFLHGWGANCDAFAREMNSLCGEYRVTAIDFAGFGDSDEPSAHGVDDYAADLIELLDLLCIKQATFVGHSFGGRVAIFLAAYHPQYVKKLVLVDSAGVKPRRKPSYYIKVAMHKTLKKLGLNGLGGSCDYQKASDNMKKTFVKVVNYDERPILKNIGCKTAIFWGDKDKETPMYMYRHLKKHIHGADGFVLRGGHFAYLEDAYAFDMILKAFLKE